MNLLSTKSYLIHYFWINLNYLLENRPVRPNYELKMKHSHCDPRAALQSAEMYQVTLKVIQKFKELQKENSKSFNSF